MQLVISLLEIRCIFSYVGSIEVYQSAMGTERYLERLPDIHWNMHSTDVKSDIALTVDTANRQQRILGFGGAFTEASAINWHKLSPSAREEVLHLYFDTPEKGGNGFVMGRVHINSCDFSPTPYTFDDFTEDTGLDKFDENVTHDAETMIPFIRAASERISSSHSTAQRSAELKIIGSPWSPPAWMKNAITSNSGGESHEGSLMGSARPMGLNPKYSNTWARYISKFVSAYKRHGIQLWAVTAQNEPEFSAAWESCVLSPRNESMWIREHLGPVLRRDHPLLKILAYDHNKDHVVKWAEEMYNADNGATARFVDGLAVHWYAGAWFERLKKAVDLGGPSKWMIASEASNCGGVMVGSDRLEQRWARAERLAYDALGDISAGAHAWLDWNLLVDPSGGPTHVSKTSCDAHVIADPERKLQGTTLIRQPSYYYIGHISRFALQDSTVVGLTRGEGVIEPTSASTADKFLEDQLHEMQKEHRQKALGDSLFIHVAFEAPDADERGLRRVSVVVLNRGDQPVKHTLRDAVYGVETSVVWAPPRSITTYVYTHAEDEAYIRFYAAGADANLHRAFWIASCFLVVFVSGASCYWRRRLSHQPHDEAVWAPKDPECAQECVSLVATPGSAGEIYAHECINCLTTPGSAEEHWPSNSVRNAIIRSVKTQRA